MPDGVSELVRLEDFDLIAETDHPGHELVDALDVENEIDRSVEAGVLFPSLDNVVSLIFETLTRE